MDNLTSLLIAFSLYVMYYAYYMNDALKKDATITDEQREKRALVSRFTVALSVGIAIGVAYVNYSNNDELSSETFSINME